MAIRKASLIDSGTTGRPVQRWATVATWTAFGCALPSIAWRVAMMAGVDTGFAEADAFRGSAGLTVYVAALEVVELGAAVACLGLAHRWGERVPKAVPWLGGRVIPRRVPVVAGSLGAAALMAIFYPLAASFAGSWLGLTDAWTPADGMNAAQIAVLAVCYAPLLVWPWALLVALVGYWRRRSPESSAVRMRRTGALASST